MVGFSEKCTVVCIGMYNFGWKNLYARTEHADRSIVHLILGA